MPCGTEFVGFIRKASFSSTVKLHISVFAHNIFRANLKFMSKKGTEPGVYKAHVGEEARTDRQKSHNKNPNKTIINLY